jgi:hypothetical protein
MKIQGGHSTFGIKIKTGVSAIREGLKKKKIN